MKTLMLCCLLMLLSADVSHADITRRLILNSDGTKEHAFYSGEKKIATQFLDDDGNIEKSAGVIPDGTVKEFYENRNLKAEWNYKSGKLDGLSNVYFENGEIMFKVNYKDGKRDGITKSYYKGLKLKYKYEYKDDKYDGIVRKYFRNGALAFEWNYKRGKREGEAKAYFKKGSVRALWNFKKNQLTGINRIYYNNGVIKHIDTYRNGFKVNRKAFDRRGKLDFEQDYPGGEKDEK